MRSFDKTTTHKTFKLWKARRKTQRITRTPKNERHFLNKQYTNKLLNYMENNVFVHKQKRKQQTQPSPQKQNERHQITKQIKQINQKTKKVRSGEVARRQNKQEQTNPNTPPPKKEIERTPKGAYLTRGRSRHLLETPFSEALLRTLLRTFFTVRLTGGPLLRNPSENPPPEPFPEPSQNPS